MGRVIRADHLPRVVPAAIAGARADASAIRAAAREEGLAAAQAECAAALLNAAATRDRLLADAEEEVREVVAALTRRVVAEELRLAPEHIRAVVRDAIDRLRRAPSATIHVHPDDSALLEESLASAATVTHDPTLTRGGCVVTSRVGEVDARLETRIDRLLDALAKGRP